MRHEQQSNPSLYQTPSFGFHAPPDDPRQSMFDKFTAALTDPRNAWMGMGPGGVAMAAPKIGASAAKIGRMTGEQALRLYEAIEKHEGLTRFLKRMGVGVLDRMEARHMADNMISPTLPDMISAATRVSLRDPLRSRNFWSAHPNIPGAQLRTAQTLGELNPIYGKEGWDMKLTESATQGNAAYGAVSRQVGRMLDEIKAGTRQWKFGETGPAPVSEAEYYKQIPISPSTESARDAVSPGRDVVDRAWRENLERYRRQSQ